MIISVQIGLSACLLRTARGTTNLPGTLHVRSAGRLSPIRTSTIITLSPSLRIDTLLGTFLSQWTIRTRCNQAEVVFLRSEANRANPAINPSVIAQFKNPRVFSDGKIEGFGNKVEKRSDMFPLYWMVSVSRAGKDDGFNATGRPV